MSVFGFMLDRRPAPAKTCQWQIHEGAGTAVDGGSKAKSSIDADPSLANDAIILPKSRTCFSCNSARRLLSASVAKLPPSNSRSAAVSMLSPEKKKKIGGMRRGWNGVNIREGGLRGCGRSSLRDEMAGHLPVCIGIGIGGGPGGWALGRCRRKGSNCRPCPSLKQ